MKSSVYPRSDIPFLRNDRPLIMAHRGRSAYTPESSYQSFKEAYDLDVDVLETDIRLTKDGIPVIFHDESLDREQLKRENLFNLIYEKKATQTKKRKSTTTTIRVCRV